MHATQSVTSIVAHPDCQPRLAVDDRVVDEYADAMAGGAEFPPLTVYHDGDTYWLADGFHRYAAARSLGLAEIACDVRQGGKRDAILHSCGANASHGLRRTNGDKGRAVDALLGDPEWSAWSDSEIARRCGVSHTFVSSKRASLATVASERTYTDRYGNVRTMDTSNIGRRFEPTPALSATTPVRSLPPSMPAVVADDYFADAQAFEPEPIPDAVDWDAADGQAFVLLQKAIDVIDRDAVAVAFAAYGTNPLGAQLFAKRSREFARWVAAFTDELNRIAE